MQLDSRSLTGASVVAVGVVLLLLLSLVSGYDLMFVFGCTQGCLVPCVLLCFRRSRARWEFLVDVVAGCLGPCSCAPVLVLLVRARGPALRLGVCLWGFPAVVCAVTPLPTIASLCNTHSRGCAAATEHRPLQGELLSVPGESACLLPGCQ